MGRPTGLKRIVKAGEQGPKMETLIKTVEKHTRKISRKSSRNLPKGYSLLEFVTKKRYRNDVRIAASKALSAIGLDARKPGDRKLRAKVHRIIQKMADLDYDTTMHPDRKYDPETHIAAKETQKKLINLLFNARGPEKSKKFMAALARHISFIDIAHKEASKRIKT